MNPREVFGFVLVEEALEKARDSPYCRSVFTLARCERTRDESIERAINQRVSVDEEEPW
jgi:hypothetical protein